MSAICPRFSQNAWKKDLCSNCFKSREEHLRISASTNGQSINVQHSKTITPQNATPPKGIMKGLRMKPKKSKVSFPKELTEVIGYGGEWSENETTTDEEDNVPQNERDDHTATDDEDDRELRRLTKTNTDFNTNNGNLLGDPEENIKKSFAALRLGTPQVDSDGKKQTLKISVTPFGANTKTVSAKKSSSTKSKVETQRVEAKKGDSKLSNIQDSPPLERAMERSLLEEISETLERQKSEAARIQSDKDGKIKFEVTSELNCVLKSNADGKKMIARNAPITKDHTKPKVNVFHKYSDSESNASDCENGVSAYYDVVESSGGLSDNHGNYSETESGTRTPDTDKSLYSASPYMTSYSMHDGNYISSKITSDGLIVTKCNSDDAIDSTGSSFDGSSDEETSYNMNRSESDSGIGISIGSEYQSMVKDDAEKKAISSDYEDIQVITEKSTSDKRKEFSAEKSRELAGEPDGSADPDGNVEAPALPKSPPPPTVDPRISFLHGMQKNITNKKPDVPAKPTTVLKTFAKRQPTAVEQNVISQLQQVIHNPNDNTSESGSTLGRKEGSEYSKLLKKGRAPNPPPASPEADEREHNLNNFEKEPRETIYFESKSIQIKTPSEDVKEAFKNHQQQQHHQLKAMDDQHTSIYTRNPTVGTKSNSPVIREKDKRERATVNPKFRSLNTFSSNKKNQIAKPSTPEPAPRKILSMSEECLVDEKKKKNKFSIRKFLRMGVSKTTDNLHKKDGIYSEIAATDDNGIVGKPRLVIIHPIDINQSEVEVVKDISKPLESMPLVTGKPPAPPQRHSEQHKPTRPPPPKSAELRKKQKHGFNVNTTGTGSLKSKSDNVYANLGEIRSAIAPRKPERTASMREREAQLELARKRQGIENADTISVCSSNGGNVSSSEICSTPTKELLNNTVNSNSSTTKPSITEMEPKESNKMNSFERREKFGVQNKIASKLELFEKSSTMSASECGKGKLNDGLKNSVLKINNTIDSYLKDKRDFETSYETGKTPPSTPIRSSETDLRRGYDGMGSVRQQQHHSRMSIHETASISSASLTRSEYGTRYGFNSLANIPRVVSASYCGSEMGESDIYSPYSFYGSEAGGDIASDIHEGVWGVTPSSKVRVKTTNRLRMRKGRSVVHKSIEDNYNAVIVANHEALAQVLEQLQQQPAVPIALRPLANSMNLRFEDFNIIEGSQAFVVGKRAFHPAIWANNPVTLALSSDCNQISGVSGELNQLSGGVCDVLNPITEFFDLVPSYHLPLMPSTEVRMLQSTISVLPRLQMDSLQSIGTILKNKSQVMEKHTNFRGSIPNLSGVQRDHASSIRNVNSVQNLSTLNEESGDTCLPAIPGMPCFDDVMCREIGFIMLQLINGLKNLQAKAIEEMPLTLSNVILCKEFENKDAQARLCVLHG
ncbi:uncharacterized protein LOC119651284 isoform X2 [Hermetia illucens]|nr:uncharacterized protein LOC119651284 isoform X2 [Hermetia illucens]